MSLTISPIRDGHDPIVGAATGARDITEHKLAERALEQMLADLNEAQRIAMLGLWAWNPAVKELTWRGSHSSSSCVRALTVVGSGDGVADVDRDRARAEMVVGDDDLRIVGQIQAIRAKLAALGSHALALDPG